MGKSKHKKHHRHGPDDEEGSSQDGGGSSLAASGGEGSGGSGLKLILKVGSGSKSHSGEKHKKKKKKKDRKKEKEHKHRHHHKDKRNAELILDSIKREEDVVVMKFPTLIKREEQQQQQQQHLQPQTSVVVPMDVAPSRSTPPAEVMMPVKIPILPQVSNIKVENTFSPSYVTPPQTSSSTAPTTFTSAKPVTIVNELSRKSLQKLLEYFLNHLQRKDVNQFFAIPVNDLFAPGYSTIIKEPMDFSTMRNKLTSGKYQNLAAFKSDFELMCNNACVYNLPETVYYKAAKKLLHQGQKLISQEKVQSMKSQAPYVKQIAEAELGFDILADENNFAGGSQSARESLYSGADDDEDDDVSKVIEDIREVVRRPIGRFEAIPDDMSPLEILDQVRAAARGAANRLRIYKPKSRMGYLRQRSDGITSGVSLRFLPGGGSGKVSESDNERPVSLAALIGRVKQGSGSIQGYREDRRNLAKSVAPLEYGAHSTHGPTYDSTFANLTKEETDLVNSAYGDEVGVQYAESILNFSRSCDYAMFIVDHLLEILTGNEHRKTSKYIEEQKALRREDDMVDLVLNTDDESSEAAGGVDFDSLRSLAEVGIDVSFLDSMQEQLNAETSMTVAASVESLHENADLINQLREIQQERLSAAQPSHLSQVTPPNERELELASRIQKNLVELASQVRPGDVAAHETIKKILGISLNPTPKPEMGVS